MRSRIALLALTALSWLSFHAYADENLVSGMEEIVVTAEFRDTAISELPVSVSVIDIDSRGDVVNHLEEVLSYVPNVNIASGASRGRFIQIRGIGERGQFGEPLNSSVGLVVDGVDLSGIGTAATLFDVQQVEVLRGPQGTLYGANALAGLINVVTNDPTEEFSGNVRFDAGDYGMFGAGGVISGPLSESVGYRISFQQYRDDGFIDNDFLGRDDTDNHDESTLRAKFVWGSDQMRWRLNLGRIDIDNGYDAFSLDNNRTTLSDEPGQDSQLTKYASLGVEWDVNDSVTFEAQAAVTSSDIDYGYDEDWTFTGFDPIGYTSTDLYARERDTSTLEARWLSNNDSGTNWVIGVYALRQNVDLDRTYTFAGPFASDYQIERTALYGEVVFDVSENMRLTVGGRVERSGAEYDDTNGVDFDPDDDHFGARILLEQDLGDNGFVYAGVTQGYKTGGFNQDGSLPADLREFDEETLWNFEVGYKGTLFDDRLIVDAAVFRMQREDIQTDTSTIRPIPGNPVGEFIEFTGNAAEGYNQGLEIQTQFFVTENLLLFANFGWLDTEYDDYTDSSGRDLSGREQAHAPEYQFFVGAEYDFGNGWRASVELEGKDEFFFSASHDEKSDAYELVNASVGYYAESWSARVWARNIGDEDYFVRGFRFGNDPRDFYTARPFTQLGEPSRVGVSVNMTF